MQGFKVLAAHCGGNAAPTIAQVYTPGSAWRDADPREPATAKALARLKRAGVTTIAVEVEPGTTRLADFKLTEIADGGKIGGQPA